MGINIAVRNILLKFDNDELILKKINCLIRKNIYSNNIILNYKIYLVADAQISLE